MPSRLQSNMAPAPRRRKIGQRRGLEDEDDEVLDVIDDDTVSEASLPSDDNLHGNDSDTSNIDESFDASAAGPSAAEKSGNGAAKHARRSKQLSPPTPAGVAESNPRIQSKSNTEDIANDEDERDADAKVDVDEVVQAVPNIAAAPLIVSSSLASKPRNASTSEDTYERRRREHDEYRRKRDADPAFVPNRGNFFMHDYRSAAPAGNGFRPFGRGGRGGGGRGGRGGIGGPYAPMNQMHGHPDPLTSNQWSHDMHETLDNPIPARAGRRISHVPQTSYAGDIPKCEESKEVINRHMSTERQLGNISIRIFLPHMEEPKYMAAIVIKQYTMLPDHRPPLRRDKPARIFLEGMPMPKLIFPATDRSFIFIPRAMRPNQQRGRGKARSTLGSIGGFSRRTSVFGGNSIYNGSMYGGSMYGGSMYSPSVAMSRRSSIGPGPDMVRDMISPAGSTISRPTMPMEPPRPVPVVRLPQPRPDQAPYAPQFYGQGQQGGPMQAPIAPEGSITNIPQPQMHPLPDKPTFENRPAPIPMHQPTPKREVLVENIESPTMSQHQNYQQAFHHQVPVQAPNPYEHARQASYPSTGTPLSQIPEKAIHAVPFQPNYNQGGGYYNAHAPPQMAPPPQPPPPPQQQPPQQPGYYYTSQGYAGPPTPAAPFAAGGQQQQGGQIQIGTYGMDIPVVMNTEPNTHTAPGSNTVGMAVNGTVFYSDASQMPPSAPSYPNYQAPYYPPPGAPPMDMGGPPPPMGPPVNEGYYYPPQPQGGAVYYQQ